eukprot:4641305-Prymnesium_polylepis.1
MLLRNVARRGRQRWGRWRGLAHAAVVGAAGGGATAARVVEQGAAAPPDDAVGRQGRGRVEIRRRVGELQVRGSGLALGLGGDVRGGARGGAERSRQMQRYVVEHVPPEPVSKKSWALEMAQPGATELMGRVMKPEL